MMGANGRGRVGTEVGLDRPVGAGLVPARCPYGASDEDGRPRALAGAMGSPLRGEAEWNPIARTATWR